MIIYGQRTADDRFAFGGRGAPVPLRQHASSPSTTATSGCTGCIHDTLREMFPAIGDAAITHRWGGAVGAPPRLVVLASASIAATGMASAGGYVGDGVGTTNLAGRTLADLITGTRQRARLAAVGRSPVARSGSPSRCASSASTPWRYLPDRRRPPRGAHRRAVEVARGASSNKLIRPLSVSPPRRGNRVGGLLGEQPRVEELGESLPGDLLRERDELARWCATSPLFSATQRCSISKNASSPMVQPQRVQHDGAARRSC